MGVLADWQIKDLALKCDMIVPFDDGQVRSGVLSYGVSSYGYDMRLGRTFRVFRGWALDGSVPYIDPKKFDPTLTEEIRDADFCIIPANGFVLAESVETFRIPREIVTIAVGKSTYARVGLILNVTPAEPEWQGKLTLELSNTTQFPIKVYAGEGIGQLLFLRGEAVCQRSYLDKKGKYQGQTGLTLPCV